MTTRPRLKLGTHLWRGLSAVALFVVLAVVFLQAELGDPTGFADALDGSEAGTVTEGLGYTIFHIEAGMPGATEPFLVAFILIAFVLDAALGGAVMLARREETGEIVSALDILPGGEE